MKGFFETLFLALAFAWIGWLIINAGMKFEVKIKGESYGFTIGGDNKFQSQYYWFLQANLSRDSEFIFLIERRFLDKLSKEDFQEILNLFYPKYNIIKQIWVTGDMCMVTLKFNPELIPLTRQIFPNQQSIYTVI